MGGSMKGHNSSSSISNGSNGRREGKPAYGLILIMAFGAALLGVMLLHKLRDKRIFNLLLQDKDRQLISLHLLLQKEREYNKEARRKNEEMKAKLYSIRMQKRELDSSILEMRSTISSMRDERRTIDLALEEKQNEIKMLGERAKESNKENSQVMALTEILKQKEAEIKDLKHRLEYPMRVWSVSADDPSKPSVNLTAKDKFEASNVKKEGGQLEETTTRVNGNENESTNYQDKEKSRSREDRRENGVGFSDRREMTREESKKMENSQDEQIRDGSNQGEKAIDEVEAKKIGDSNGREGLGIGEAKSNTNATEIIGNHGAEVVLKTRNEDSGEKILDGKERESGEIGLQEKIDSQGGEDLENGGNSRAGMKLEMRENSQRGSRYRTGEKHGYLSRTKGQRSRLLAKSKKFERSGIFEHNRDLDLRSGRVFKDGMENGKHEKPKNGEIEKMDGHGDNIVGENRVVDRHQEGEGESNLETKTNYRVGLAGKEEGNDTSNAGKEEGNDTSNATEVEPLKPQNFKDVENISVKVAHTQSDQNVENDHSKQSMDRTIFRDQSEEKASGTQQEKESGEKADNDSEKYGEAEDLNIADVEEAKRDVLRESTSELEEDKEEYKEEEADEPEF